MLRQNCSWPAARAPSARKFPGFVMLPDFHKSMLAFALWLFSFFLCFLFLFYNRFLFRHNNQLTLFLSRTCPANLARLLLQSRCQLKKYTGLLSSFLKGPSFCTLGRPFLLSVFCKFCTRVLLAFYHITFFPLRFFELHGHVFFFPAVRLSLPFARAEPLVQSPISQLRGMAGAL